MIITTATRYDFVQWLKNSDNYKNNFSVQGAIALFDYLDELADDLDSPYEFDPVAWCCEFAEYKDFEEFQHDTGYIKDGIQHQGYENINSLDELKDNTTVIEFDGGIIVANF